MGQPKNPLLYIFQSHFGLSLATSCRSWSFGHLFVPLANMVVATRLAYSLARDKMLPGSTFLAKVGSWSKAPVYTILLVALVSAGINVLSAGITSNILSRSASWPTTALHRHGCGCRLRYLQRQSARGEAWRLLPRSLG